MSAHSLQTSEDSRRLQLDRSFQVEARLGGVVSMVKHAELISPKTEFDSLPPTTYSCGPMVKDVDLIRPRRWFDSIQEYH